MATTDRRAERLELRWEMDMLGMNSDFDRIVYKVLFVSFSAGPLLESGKVDAAPGYFGSPVRMWDTGARFEDQGAGGLSLS